MSGDSPVAPSIFSSFGTSAPAVDVSSQGGKGKSENAGGNKFRGKERSRGKPGDRGNDTKVPTTEPDSNSNANNNVSADAPPSIGGNMKGPKRNNPPGPSVAVAIAKKPEGGRGPRKNPPPTVKENASEVPQSDATLNTKDVKDDVNVAGGKPNAGSKKDRFPPRSGGKGTKDVPSKKDPSADASFKAVAAPPPPPPPPPKKSFKLVVRKLPPTKDYTKEIFEQNLHVVLNTLTAGTPSSTTWMSDVHVDHFIEGKISRKRGPVNGAGFIAFTDESLFQLFKTQCPVTIPFLADENNCQPEITPALYIKTFRQKEKVDVKYVNTYLEDPEFIAFQERASKPDSVLKAEAIAALAEKDKLREASVVAAAAAASAAASSGSGTNRIANLLQNNALLRFLREKSLAKSRRRHAAVDVARTGASNVSDKKKSRKEKKKEKRTSGDRDTAKASMSRAEKDKERSLKLKEIRKQKNEQAIVAEAMALMSASSDASKPLEEFIKEVKRSHKKKKNRAGADNATVTSADTAEASTTKPKRKAKAAKSSSTFTTTTKLSRREKDEARRTAAKAAGASGLAPGSAVPTSSPELRILQRDKGAASTTTAATATATTTQGNQKTNSPAAVSTV